MQAFPFKGRQPQTSLPMPGRIAGSADTLPQADQTLSPSHGSSGATVGDTTSSQDHTSITGEQGQRPKGQVSMLPQLGQAQAVPSRGSPPVMGEHNRRSQPQVGYQLIQQTSDPGWKVLAGLGTQLCHSPLHPPNLEYITAIESVCTNLSQQDVEELRANINRVLKGSHP